jgi:DnaJ-class molecular chaperone
MPRIHTHYDNLNVTRNAPPEVIRAAYKTLCQKFHPDRNPGNQDAAKIFLIIRSAYETLSDPVKRKEHDAWIAAAESEYQAKSDAVIRLHTIAQKSDIPRLRKLRRKRLRWQYALWLVVVTLVFFGVLFV